jgi:S-DNA-T family DNA segregation ATPase FtsK/SpoIIIE
MPRQTAPSLPRQRGADEGTLRPPAGPVRLALIRRLAELAGLAAALAGIAGLIALLSYSPHDPSFDTVASGPVRNLGGAPGAYYADAALQLVGLAGAFPSIALLAWAWRLASHRPLSLLWLRLPALVLSAVVGAVLLALLPFPAPAALPAGWGGAAGRLLGPPFLAAGTAIAGAYGRWLMMGWLAILLAALCGLAFGLQRDDWRAAARFGRHTALVTGRGLSWSGRLLHRLFAALRRRLIPLVDDDLVREAEAAPGPLPAAPATPYAIPPAPAAHPAPSPAAPVSQPPSVPPAKPREDERKPTPLPKAKEVRRGPPPPPAPSEVGWQLPPLSLLRAAPSRSVSGPSAESLQNTARLLEAVLADYGVQGAIRDIRPGPVVTLYELEPAPGIRSARVIGLADDVARSLSVIAVRIATVPGRNVIGIEVPNAKREMVYLSELLQSEEWRGHPGQLVIALGKDISGAPVVADLARMPHLLIAGTTGSGKSVGVNAMILSLLYRLSPEQCRLILIDPKMLELSVYEGIPHLLAPVVTEPRKAVIALKWTVREMERRYRAMSQLGVRNILGYNERVLEARARGEVVTRRVQTGFDPETGRPVFEDQPLALEPLPFIVVVIDEMADLMMVAGKEIEAAVQRLAQMARAAGIHVIMATQRPSVDVITGTIKANFPTRISFQVISKFDSRTILGEQGAEQLLGQGDMLYMMGGGRIVRTHGPFVSDREVEEVVSFLRAQGEPAYVDDVTEGEEDGPASGGAGGGSGGADGERSLYEQAVELVAREGKASTSFLQRHLQIGYNRAAKLIEQMEKDGIVSPANHVGKREVLVGRPKED